jgi:hypothetical protein
MNNHHLPRALVVLLFILLILTFLAGTLQAFVPVNAALQANTAAQVATLYLLPATSELSTSSPAEESTQPAEEEEEIPSPTPDVAALTADTTGVIALAILLVVIVLVGTILGERKPHKARAVKAKPHK